MACHYEPKNGDIIKSERFKNCGNEDVLLFKIGCGWKIVWHGFSNELITDYRTHEEVVRDFESGTWKYVRNIFDD